MRKYSVLMPLYKTDNPEWFRKSITSMLLQTVMPDEVVIVIDGKIGDELSTVLQEYTLANPGLFTIKQLETNVGLGLALQHGVTICRNELIARMDADDYSRADRCEIQIGYFEKDPQLDVVGSNVDEFIDTTENVVSHVILPESMEQITKFAKGRCPIRHPALMYKKSAVLKAGNYNDFRRGQDYDLIARMIHAGAKIYNIQEVLVYMRVSSDFYKRRGGWLHIQQTIKMKKGLFDIGFYSLPDFIFSVSANVCVGLMPNILRELVYKKLLRNRVEMNGQIRAEGKQNVTEISRDKESHQASISESDLHSFSQIGK